MLVRQRAAGAGSSGQLRQRRVRDAHVGRATGRCAFSYVIEAGSFPAGRNLAIIVTDNAATSFSARGVSAATYYVRVRAANRAGPSVPSNEIVVTVSS